MAIAGGVLVEETVGVRGGDLKEIALMKEGERKEDGERGVGAVEGVISSAENPQELSVGAQRFRMEDRQSGDVEMPMLSGVEWLIERNVDQEARWSAEGGVLQSNGKHRGGLRGSRK
ncbi:MAG: hypothetical protein PHR35_23160 [Kiritimatiellae bacterium]|nr:hypothetical protein [Kiritimatiellia bacterium]